MQTRRNSHDVTNSVDTTEVVSVQNEVSRIFVELYPSAPSATLDQSFADVERLYRGEYPGYRACDTDYHNLQHTLDVSLAMARMMDGYERSAGRKHKIGPRLFIFGVIAALLHDIGYLRHRNDTTHRKGAEYTLTHVSRGGKFIDDYMHVVGMPELAPVAVQILHFTGYERTVDRIKVPNTTFRLLGNMLGTADIIAQMSDRCYLEKCRDRLYPEFVAGGLARSEAQEKLNSALFSSAADLVFKTPNFYSGARVRLNDLLGSVYNYAENHFGNQNLYLNEIDNNVRYARSIARERDLSLLRRTPPQSQPDDSSRSENSGEGESKQD